jgi:hypothetical protein
MCGKRGGGEDISANGWGGGVNIGKVVKRVLERKELTLGAGGRYLSMVAGWMECREILRL